MKEYLIKIIDYFSKEPRNLFLTDALGAGLTTLSLICILRYFNDYFGMPSNSLMVLSIIGSLYFAYSISCYFFLKNYWARCLRIISIFNLIYCLVTIMILSINFYTVTQIGLAYFLYEILIIMLIVMVELRVAKNIDNID
jgi:hypothetical protein